jgi:hypothetical protein
MDNNKRNQHGIDNKYKNGKLNENIDPYFANLHKVRKLFSQNHVSWGQFIFKKRHNDKL